MNQSRFAGIGAELKAKKAGGKRRDVDTSERVDGPLSEHAPIETARPTESKRKAGKRASGYIQIAGLIPPETRDGLNVALAFEMRDLSQLLTDLLNDWLASQPAHVQAAIEAKRNS